jgi:hypothetical protein
MPSYITSSGLTFSLLQPNDCIGDSLGYFNANTQNFLTLVNTASANLVTRFTPTAGSTLQTVLTSQALGNISPGAAAADTGIPALSITRKSTTSKLLLEAVGARCNLNAGEGLFTWFAVSEDNGTTWKNATNAGPTFNNTDSLEFFTVGAGSNISHSAKCVYTPTVGVNTIQFKIYTKKYAGTPYWNYISDGYSTYLTRTITEIAT